MSGTAIVKIIQPRSVKYNFFDTNKYVALCDFSSFHIRNICTFDNTPITKSGFDRTHEDDGYGMWVFNGEDLTEIDIIASVSRTFNYLHFEFMYVSSLYKIFCAGSCYRGHLSINHEFAENEFLEYVSSAEYLFTREHWLEQIKRIDFYAKESILKNRKLKQYNQIEMH